MLRNPMIVPSKTYVYEVTMATTDGPNWTRSFTFAPVLSDIVATLKLEIKHATPRTGLHNLRRLLELIDYIPNGSCWSVLSVPYAIKAVRTTIGTIYRRKTEAYEKCKQ